jgi:hypothetical protein
MVTLKRRMGMLMIGFACAIGCGDDGEGGAPGGNGDEHTEVTIGSSAVGGGMLVGEYDYADDVHLAFAACLGGTGDDCAGGIALYSAANPGFTTLEEDEPEESLFTLAADTPVTLEVTAIDEGLSVRFGEVTLDAPGETTLLGRAPFHADVEVQAAVAGGEIPAARWNLAFRLTTTVPAYAASSEYTLHFRVGEGEHHE